MYTPHKFRVDQPEIVMSFIQANPFGLILSVNGNEIHDTHTPFVLSQDREYLIGHIAKANPHWESWKPGTKSKVIFTGPHAYISPSYYTSEINVPTWNYTAVSISGKIKIIEEQSSKLEFLNILVSENETSRNPWKFDPSEKRLMNLLSAIVVFTVSIEEIEATFKLNQNKSVEDQRSVILSLSNSDSPQDQQVADLMRKNLDSQSLP